MEMTKKTWEAPAVAPLATAKDAAAAVGLTGDGVAGRSRIAGS